MKTTRIIIFAKAPLPGLAKTRLTPALGVEGAANLAKKLLCQCVTEALNADIGPVELCVTPSLHHPIWRALRIPESVHWSEQGEGDLGDRLTRATQKTVSQSEAILLIGTDCPGLTAARLQQAAASLEQHNACLQPVSDGGYALLGLTGYRTSLFSDIPWSTNQVAQLTQQRIADAGWSLRLLETLHDIDEPEDLKWLPKHWLP